MLYVLIRVPVKELINTCFYRRLQQPRYCRDNICEPSISNRMAPPSVQIMPF